MNTAVKLAGFGIGLAAVFTAALGLGRIAGHTPASAPAAHGHAAATAAHGHDGTAAEPVAALPGGLQVTQDGYRLTPLTTVLSTGVPRQFRFQIIGPDGRPVIGYTTSHDRDLHLIVVRRDLSGFQHVHPRLADDGTWSIPVAVPTAGQYRVFADFQPIGHDGITLGADVPAAGDYRPVPLPAAARTATVDGYTVTLAGDLAPGASSRLALSVSRDGRPVTDLQPYLGAYGHLVALRAGDLAYLHVHPDGEPGDGRTAAGPEVVFHAEVPSAGTYRLYLDFQHSGTVHTAEFTAVAGPPVSAPSSPAGHGADGHNHD
ncbi:hypothetical protein ACWT_3586 [Actinoplanes sp. SE50]|uniref:hypothetical protein n=1 Tax=unclassified Actinoplanes TaxID=2626549 RepID=UPI00023EC2A1|nr:MULTISPECIES: hypothetical protein [unclassified Actinoplanes]AEV84609.1 hypothetical protein ACPL_3714 [Actinoplanes sp. SE50/110]ATO83001.1 hypothetical protein ACWT_3586 [Actinoplanes sp. SE50]SLM00409.1 hypothetical protein ACSP50_3641 [Actinoplanes sp. SE50/110]